MYTVSVLYRSQYSNLEKVLDWVGIVLTTMLNWILETQTHMINNPQTNLPAIK